MRSAAALPNQNFTTFQSSWDSEKEISKFNLEGLKWINPIKLKRSKSYRDKYATGSSNRVEQKLENYVKRCI